MSTLFMTLSRKFLCGTPIPNLGVDSALVTLCDDGNGVCNQEDLLSMTVDHPLVLRHPVKYAYQQMFLRTLIQKLEGCGADISDRIYGRYCELLAAVCNGTSFRHYSMTNGAIVSLKESNSIVSKGTTGLCTWEASHVLIDWCSQNEEMLRGTTILELGSGVGLSGIAISLICKPAFYFFSDSHPAVLGTLVDNLVLNSGKTSELKFRSASEIGKRTIWHGNLEACNVSVLNLPWEDVCHETFDLDLNPEFVLASDIVYDIEAFAVLSVTIKKFAESGSKVIMASAERSEETLQEFSRVLELEGLLVEQEPLPSTCFTSSAEFSANVKLIKITATNS